MTVDEARALTLAWQRWDNAPASRDRVVDLEDAIRPLAAELAASTSKTRDLVVDRLRCGDTIGEAIHHLATVTP